MVSFVAILPFENFSYHYRVTSYETDEPQENGSIHKTKSVSTEFSRYGRKRLRMTSPTRIDLDDEGSDECIKVA